MASSRSGHWCARDRPCTGRLGAAVIAWVLGASGVWGRAVAVELLDRGYDIVALGRSNPQALAEWAASRARDWSFARFDLVDPCLRDLPTHAPDVLVCAAGVIDGDAVRLVAANYVAVSQLIRQTADSMRLRGGRIGLFLPQNARLGLRGLGEYSAAYAALWTWAEAFQAELRGDSKVTLTRVIPPRAASTTQRVLAARSRRTMRTHRPQAAPLVDAILSGRPRAGRPPWLAALSTALR
jgi:NAD(P)-dependent dehydrogenase (short-subunit alcohol dehydrogenase family)